MVQVVYTFGLLRHIIPYPKKINEINNMIEFKSAVENHFISETGSGFPISKP